MGTVIVVTSGKGGTGKTSLTGGVASCLAALGRQVLCIDMDIGLRNLDISLGPGGPLLFGAGRRGTSGHPKPLPPYRTGKPSPPPVGREFHAGPAAAGPGTI